MEPKWEWTLKNILYLALFLVFILSLFLALFMGIWDWTFKETIGNIGSLGAVIIGSILIGKLWGKVARFMRK